VRKEDSFAWGGTTRKKGKSDSLNGCVNEVRVREGGWTKETQGLSSRYQGADRWRACQ